MDLDLILSAFIWTAKRIVFVGTAVLCAIVATAAVALAGTPAGTPAGAPAGGGPYWCQGLNDLQCVLFEAGHPRIP